MVVVDGTGAVEDVSTGTIEDVVEVFSSKSTDPVVNSPPFSLVTIIGRIGRRLSPKRD